MDKKDVILTHTHTHIYTEEYYYVSQKKKWNFADLEGIIPSEISQRQILYAMTLYFKLEKYNKLVNVTKKETHR